MKSTLVTLVTDWGDRDFFAGMVKGKLYSYIPDVAIVDITHSIDPYATTQAVFVVKNACLGFPPGTIHIIDISSSETPESPFVAVEYKGSYFICTDNGLPGAVFGNEASQVVTIDTPRESDFYTFAARDLFCRVAAQLSQGVPLADIGTPCELTIKTPLKPDLSKPMIQVPICYVDNYGNAYLDITYDEFEKLRQGRPFVLYAREYGLTTLSRSYFDVPNGTVLLTVSATGHLQIAIREGSAEQLLGLQSLQMITIKFKP